MKIFVDADACPVINIIEKVAEEYGIEVTLFCDTNHILHSEYSKIKVIGAGTDAVDFALVNSCQKGDVVITQDYGVAVMTLGRGAYAIHQSGKWYTDENIDGLLMQRHLVKKVRRTSSKHHLKGQRKRNKEDDIIFEKSFLQLIEKVKQGE